MKVKIAISGCSGKMGKIIASLAFKEAGIKVVSGIEKKGHSSIGGDLALSLGNASCGISISCDISKAISITDVLIEFTDPETTLKHLEIVSAYKKKMVIGTTGFKESQIKRIKEISSKTAILMSPNMSIGVNVLLSTIKEMVKLLGDNYDIEIIEMHHNKKKDAPSGTAKEIANVIKQVRRNIKVLYGREGITGSRGKNELCIHALRLGDIIGEHKIILSGNNERVELSHSAGSREIFAKGAILAAKYIAGKKYGLYTMQDMLNERLK